MAWRSVTDVGNAVRNMVRRGYLVSTDYSGKMPKGRVKTGHKIENDQLDIMHSVGFMSRHPAGKGVEVLTLDVGGDASRRVVLGVIGDRATFPEGLAEGDAVQYAPGDPKKKLSISKDKGVSLEADDKNMSLSTKEHMSMGAKTADLFGGAISVDEAGNVTFKGNLTVQGNLTVGQNLHVGGGTQIEGSLTVNGHTTSHGGYSQ